MIIPKIISCSYGHMSSLAQQAKGSPVHFYYFVCKITPGIFTLNPPEECQVVLRQHRAVFQYKSDKGNWLSREHFSMKNNSYYFRTKEEAEAAFKVAVKDAKKHFKDLIKSSEKALEILDKI